MTVDGITSRLSEFFSWLYHRQWERWEFLAIAIAALVILIIIVKAHFYVADNKKRIRERSPIVGVQKANRKKRHK
jgi:hypothetical protein